MTSSGQGEASGRPETVDALRALLEREIGRRGVLRGSLSGTALLALGSLIPASCRSYPEPPVTLRVLSRDEYAVVQAAARAILGLTTETIDVAAEVDAVMARMDESVQRDIHWILRIFEHGTHLFDLKGRRFTRLSPADQDRYLRGWMMSSMGARRIVFRALKLLSALGYYRLPETWKDIGYDGPWLGRREEERRFSFEPAVPVDSLPIA